MPVDPKLAWRVKYETVAAGSTAQALGAAGAAGDILERIIIIPATTGAGNVSIKDGAGSDISIFVAGTLADLTPISIEFNMPSRAGKWAVTTGANVSVIAIGQFS